VGVDKNGAIDGAIFTSCCLLGDGIDRTAVQTGLALGAIVVDGVFVGRLDNGANRAGVHTGAASDTVVGNLESHEILLVGFADEERLRSPSLLFP
jgi:hypothetical protein